VVPCPFWRLCKAKSVTSIHKSNIKRRGQEMGTSRPLCFSIGWATAIETMACSTSAETRFFSSGFC
jgi:hypothetical protein